MACLCVAVLIPSFQFAQQNNLLGPIVLEEVLKLV